MRIGPIVVPCVRHARGHVQPRRPRCRGRKLEDAVMQPRINAGCGNVSVSIVADSGNIPVKSRPNRVGYKVSSRYAHTRSNHSSQAIEALALGLVRSIVAVEAAVHVNGRLP